MTSGQHARAEASPGRDLAWEAWLADAPDGIFVSDQQGRYVTVNDAGCRLLDLPREQILGKTAFDLIDPEQVQTLSEHAVRLSAERVERFEWSLKLLDGGRRTVEVHAKLLPDGRRISFLRDITERKRFEGERDSRVDALERLISVNDLFVSGQSAETILHGILDAAIAIAGADYGVVQIFDDRASELRIVAQRALPGPWLDYWDRVASGRGACGVAFERGARVIVPDVASSAFFDPADATEWQARADIRSSQSTPLLGRSGTKLGVISTLHRVPGGPPPSALRLLDLLARQAADILERARVEAELRRAEAESRSILATAADAIICIDAERRVILWNHAAEKMFGYSRHEAQALSIDVLLPERLRAAHRTHVAEFAHEVTSGRKMDHQQAVGVRKSGEEFPISAAISHVEVNGELLMTVSVRDISQERRAADEQGLLAETGRALSSLDVDEATHELLLVTVQWLADSAVLWGLDEDDELRRLAVASSATRSPPSDAWMSVGPDRDAHPVWQAIDARRTILSEDALRIWAPLLVSGRAIGLLGLARAARPFGARDMTMAEELARRSAPFIENARLRRAEQRATRARDEILGIVAHDLRSPLNAMLLTVETLRRRNGERRDTTALDQIRVEGRHMNRMLEDLLDVASLDAGRKVKLRPRAVAAANIVEGAVTRMRLWVEQAEHVLSQSVEPGLPELLVDTDRMAQVLDNLIVNAVKFSPRRTAIEISACADSDHVVFSVHNLGQPIPVEALPHVFDRLWQAGERGIGGVGLGLFIVKHLVELHGGYVSVASDAQGGTRFSFSIPAARSSEPDPG
jgi:PAS domain S-box-containing protein